MITSKQQPTEPKVGQPESALRPINRRWSKDAEREAAVERLSRLSHSKDSYAVERFGAEIEQVRRKYKDVMA